MATSTGSSRRARSAAASRSSDRGIYPKRRAAGRLWPARVGRGECGQVGAAMFEACARRCAGQLLRLLSGRWHEPDADGSGAGKGFRSYRLPGSGGAWAQGHECHGAVCRRSAAGNQLAAVVDATRTTSTPASRQASARTEGDAALARRHEADPGGDGEARSRRRAAGSSSIARVTHGRCCARPASATIGSRFERAASGG